MTAKPARTAQKQSTARRSGRSKIAVAQTEHVEADVLAKKLEEEDEPDYGYAPPQPIALPDPPLNFDYEDFPPPLTKEELLRELNERYPNSPKDENGLSLRLKKEQEEDRKFEEKRIQESLSIADAHILPTTEELNKQVDAMIAAGPKKQGPQVSSVDTAKARSAAVALSQPPPRLPAAVTRPTQASEQKKIGILPTTKPKAVAIPSAPASRRPGHAAVSRNTIGFPKAKKAPSIIPSSVRETKPTKVDQSKINPVAFRDLYGSPPVESDMWFRLKAYELLEDAAPKEDGDDLADDLFEADFFPFENSRLDDEDFQLPMPE